MKTIQERRAYSRGYYKGASGAWPPHKPPLPPNDLLAAFISAAQGLRDGFDSMCATFSEDDEIVRELDTKIEAFDAAMRSWTKWLLEPPPLSTDEEGSTDV